MISFRHLPGLGAPPHEGDGPDKALTWDYWGWKGQGDERFYLPLATTACDQGHIATISPKVHSIAPDGTLSPSCVCPRAGCSFHEFVQLEGWRAGRRDRERAGP